MRGSAGPPIPADLWRRWRLVIVAHLEDRRIGWDEHTLLTWLGAKADAETSAVRTTWHVLADRTGLTSRGIATLFRRLRVKGYLADRTAPGRPRGLRELVIVRHWPDGADRAQPSAGAVVRT
jgi:hypothetical protein